MSLWIGTLASSIKKESVIQNGLILHVDPDNTLSYSGSGSTIYNLVNNQAQTFYGTYSKSDVGVRLTNTSSTATSNVSRLQFQSYSGIRMISTWVYIHSKPATTYILDARGGSANGYVWLGQIGPDWPYMYVNNGSRIVSSTTEAFTEGAWRFLTFEHTSSFTDDVTMYARFSNNEALNATVGQTLMYNRVLSSQEVSDNFNATKSIYGL